MIRRCPYLFRAAADLGSLSGLRKNSEMRLATGLRFCIVPDADFYRLLREGFAASSSNGAFNDKYPVCRMLNPEICLNLQFIKNGFVG
jgi:hypothetical protein